ncbi:TPA: hypothetical protein I9080_003000 [Clostridium perfringens]|uniref:PIN domain-containing protein n=1 Tax=Clostridium perfringens TaxID=1502 RepID=A0A8H9R0Q1_CLOPF|nr:hypothetical protein [Clostridium perfringens]EGT3605622.1 hypothetical protein [Clostridium perfringens]HAT4309156.1 hypothetical protein [Clostridium perfringens]
MPISNEMKKYPICDTDIWIKSCKLKKENYIFDKFNKLVFSDAVIVELENKKNDNKDEFGIGYDSLNKYKDYYHELSIKDKIFFNSKERKIAKRLFHNNKIDYNYETNSFDKRTEHLGEKVSLIYASIHNMSVMLSDDNDSKEYKSYIRNRFKTVKIINLVDLLIMNGISKDDALKIRKEVSKSVKEKELEREVEKQLNKNSTVNRLSLLKEAMIKKGIM